MRKRHCSVLLAASLLAGLPGPLAAQNYTVYFGDLHQHSAFSWDAKPGAKTPAEAYAYAKHVAGLDFMAITDHTNKSISDPSKGLTESDYQAVRAAAGRYEAPDSQFVAIAGQELGSLGSTGYGHMNIFEAATRADNASDDDTRYNLNHAYQFLIDNDLLGQFNHPTTDGGNRNFNRLEYFQAADVHVNSIEVINGKRSEDYERYYLLALANGWHVGAVGDQDNHAGAYGNSISSAGDIYLTGLLAEGLTKPNILAAIQNHRTFAFEASPASDRMYLTTFTADGHWMGELFDDDDGTVHFNIAAHAQSPFLSAQLYKNGELIDAFIPEGNQINWAPDDAVNGEAAYYFVKLVQQDTDYLWSSPIWVNPQAGSPAPLRVVRNIREVREITQDGLPARLGWANVTVRGVATAGPQFGASGPGFLQDSTGGVAVFGSLFVSNVIPTVPLEFEVTGGLSFYNGQTEIIPYEVKRVGVNAFPSPAIVTTGEIAAKGELYEGRLVQVRNATITGQFPPAGSSGNLTVDDGTGPCLLRIDGQTNIPGTAAPRSKVTITAIVNQFDTAPPYDSGYQLLPRSTEDFQTTTGVEGESDNALPLAFNLAQNYPNPFNPRTRITFELPVPSETRLQIFTLSGRLVRELMRGEVAAGRHTVEWDGLDDARLPVASGVYVYRLHAGEFVAQHKMVLLH